MLDSMTNIYYIGYINNKGELKMAKCNKHIKKTSYGCNTCYHIRVKVK